jgi:hypothetical protein
VRRSILGAVDIREFSNALRRAGLRLC